MSNTLPTDVEVKIEVQRGGFVKWSSDGTVDFLSPVPCPFNYGSVQGTVAEDGDPIDAVVLGPILGKGSTRRFRVWGSIDFVDDGATDTKLVCGAREPTPREWRRIRRFFWIYTWAKRAMNRARGRTGWTGVR